MQGTNPSFQKGYVLTFNNQCQKGSTLTSDHVGTNPIIISERHAQHSHMTMWEHIPQPCQKGPTLTSDNQFQKGSALTIDHVRNQSSMPKGSTLTSDNQCQKGSALTLDHVRNQSSMPKVSALTSNNQCRKRLDTYI